MKSRRFICHLVACCDGSVAALDLRVILSRQNHLGVPNVTGHSPVAVQPLTFFTGPANGLNRVNGGNGDDIRSWSV
jgi:hypothetical protein